MDTALIEVLVFKLFRAEAVTGTVASSAIVIALDIIKYRRSHYFPADKTFPVNTFHLQRVGEAFHTGIVVAAALCTHAATQIVPLQQELIIR